jgi:hypothetical protein
VRFQFFGGCTDEIKKGLTIYAAAAVFEQTEQFWGQPTHITNT